MISSKLIRISAAYVAPASAIETMIVDDDDGNDVIMMVTVVMIMMVMMTTSGEIPY